MSEITREKKLELVQQVRSQYRRNQYDMSNREQILYGRTSMPVGERPEYDPWADSVENELPASPLSFFRVRLFIALVLLAGVIVFDIKGMKIGGMAMETVFQAISTDYYSDVAEFVETMAQTAK